MVAIERTKPWFRRRRPAAVPAACAGLALLFSAPSARAQGLLERSPNLAGGWVGRPGVVQFNFMHRFRVSAAPQRKVTNTPTLTLAGGLPFRSAVGASYASNSVVAPNFPNEWELFGRVLALAQADGDPLDASVQLGYNVAAGSVDGELALARSVGPARLIVAGRGFSDAYHEGSSRLALAAGGAVRLSEHLALAGDVAAPIGERGPRAAAGGEDAAWSVGLQLGIPYSPHTLSLHVSNANTTTLQGASRGGGDLLFGFEFTVPITVRRYLSGGTAPVAAEPPPERASGAAGAGSGSIIAVSAPVEVVVEIQSLKFNAERIEIDPGTTVVWRNLDPLAHTATAADSTWDSGMIEPGESWRRTFDKPGTYPYLCTPHPFMRGVVVVRGGEP